MFKAAWVLLAFIILGNSHVLLAMEIKSSGSEYERHNTLLKNDRRKKFKSSSNGKFLRQEVEQSDDMIENDPVLNQYLKDAEELNIKSQGCMNTLKKVCCVIQ